jgi:asparagine synthase (glutamine-hydrolysing)
VCGIVATFAPSGKVSSAALARATRCVAHRGPDLQRQWVAPHGRTGLGHARLSLIDLTTGSQPMANEDEMVRIVCNGEFYDFERIRGELEARGHRFRTRSDTEIALHLYEEHGVDCIDRLRGEFAFVIWDEHRGRLLAYRDRFGIKPLFYSVFGDTLYLASEVKALFVAGVPARWDRESVYQHLFVSMDQDRTLFGGVSQVPPGHYLVADAAGLRVVRYWDLDYPCGSARSRDLTEAEHVEELRAALDEAVRVRLRADVPVGCLLSGGIDSSAVLGIAMQHVSRPIQAFTVSFDHAVYDEAPVARETAAHLGAELEVLRVTYADFAEHFADAIYHGETLGYNAHGVARYLLSRAVHRAGYKVVLAGEGGDELFAGYVFAQQDVLAGLNATPPPPAGVSLGGARGVLGFDSAFLGALAEMRAIFSALIDRGFAAEFRGCDPYRSFVERLDVTGQLAGRERPLQSLYLWCKSVFANYVLAAERLDMAHAVEVRLPLLDHVLFARVRDVPLPLLIRSMQEKYILREAARPVLTETVYRRTKQPFTSPPFTLNTSNPLYGMVEDTLRGPALAAVPFFNRSTVVALLDSLPRMPESHRTRLDPALLMILSACVLQERFGLSG